MLRNIFDLDAHEAETFFYRSESYYEGELPVYFDFKEMLLNINNFYKDDASKIDSSNANSSDAANYIIYINKNEKYTWRRYQLLNPILYVDFITYITRDENWQYIRSRVKNLHGACEGKIICASIPIAEKKYNENIKANQIHEWWENVEQNSLKSSLEFSYVFTTDIADCYPSICTHAIAWALHDENIVKENQKTPLIGNVIDHKLRNMKYGQTNGIPLGPIVMAVMAEILLASVDRELFNSLKKYEPLDYKIIRYRDDYKIFVNSKSDGELIIRNLSEILLKLNLKLNNSKTECFNDIILGSLKKDKYRAIQYAIQFSTENLQKKMIIIHSFLQEFPYSRQVCGWLSDINDEILEKINSNKLYINECEVLIGICVQLVWNNLNLHAHFSLLLSSLISIFTEKKAISIIEKISKRFSSQPHNTTFKLFLQRVALPYNYTKDFDDEVCKCVVNGLSDTGTQMNLWDFTWLNAPNEFKNMLLEQKFISKTKIKKLPKIVEKSEVDIFARKDYC